MLLIVIYIATVTTVVTFYIDYYNGLRAVHYSGENITKFDRGWV